MCTTCLCGFGGGGRVYPQVPYPLGYPTHPDTLPPGYLSPSPERTWDRTYLPPRKDMGPESIIFPQLLLRAVKILKFSEFELCAISMWILKECTSGFRKGDECESNVSSSWAYMK